MAGGYLTMTDTIENYPGFPEPVGGKYYMLHRPYYEGLLLDDFDIHLAAAPAVTGPWRDLGPILHSLPNRLQIDGTAWAHVGLKPHRLVCL